MQKPVVHSTQERDLVIHSVRDELLAFVGRKFAHERGHDLQALGPDALAMVEALAEGMAALHVDVMRSAADGDRGAFVRRLTQAKTEEKK